MHDGHDGTPFLQRPLRHGVAMAAFAALALLLAACGTGAGDDPTATENVLSVMATVGVEGESSTLDGSQVRGSFYIVADVRRPVDEVRFHLNGAPNAFAVDAEAPYEAWLDTTLLPDGEHVVTALSPHANGKRMKLEGEATFTVANAEPEGEKEPAGDESAPDESEDAPIPDGDTSGTGDDVGEDAGDEATDGAEDGTENGTEDGTADGTGTSEGSPVGGDDGDRSALFVVGDATAVDGNDAAIKARLEHTHGLAVDVVSDEDVTTARADGYDLVVQSKSGNAATVGTKLKHSTAPVITGEDNAQMVWQLGFIADDGSNGTYWHYTEDDLHLQNGNAPAELMAGLDGTVRVYDGGVADISFADAKSGLAPDALRIAEFGLGGAGSGQWSMYAFEEGATLADGSKAQGRRVYNGTLYDDTFTSLSSQGLALFDAQVAWLLASR